MSGAPVLRLALRPSGLLAGLIVVAHGAAAACAAAVLPGIAGFLLAAGLLGLGLASGWSRALLRAPGSIRTLEIAPAGVVLETADGRRCPAEVAGRRYVSRWLVALPLRLPSRRTLLVTADMLEADPFRRLRLWALWGKVPAVAGTQLAA